MAIPLSNVTISWANSSVTHTSFKLNVLDTGSGANSKLLDIQANSISYLWVDKYGNTNSKVITVDQLYANTLNVVVSNINLAPVYAQANAARDQANATPYISYSFFNANGTFTVPNTTNNICAIVIGAGGGGGAATGGANVANVAGGDGGYGGVAVGYVSVVPGSTIVIGIGAGGLGSNTGVGTAGGTSNVGSMTASGGGGGAVGGSGGSAGTGTNGTINNDVNTVFGNIRDTWFLLLMSLIGVNFSGKAESIYIGAQTSNRGTGSDRSANIQYVSQTTAFTPGSRGTGESTVNANNASGGVDGAVLIFY